MEITSAALFIAVSLVVFGISYYYFTTRHEERMTLIEKGLAPDYFKDNSSYLPFLLILAIVSIGISLGILAAALLRSLNLDGMGEFLFPLLIFLFLGISLLVAYFILRRMQRARNNNK